MSNTLKDFDRNASSSSYGWSFQVGAGIVLILRNIKDFNFIRMEGKYEDIEIEFDDGKMFAQAKSVTRIGDRSSASSNLAKALETLKDDAKHYSSNVKSLVYITNISNPLLSRTDANAFVYGKMYDFEVLPDDAQNNIIKQVPPTFPLKKFKLFMLNFYGEGEDKFLYIKERIEEFLRESINDTSYSKRILDGWFEKLFVNSTDKPDNEKVIILSKNEIIMPILSSVIDCPLSEESFSKISKTDNYSEINDEYYRIIRSFDFKYEFITSVMYDYNKEKMESNAGTCFKYIFVKDRWKDYTHFFEGINNEEIKEDLIKTIMLSVIEKRHKIFSIKESANLK